MSGWRLANLPNGWTVGLFPSLEVVPGVRHLVTTRGALDVQVIARDRAAAARQIAGAMGLDAVAFLDQAHGARVLEARTGGPAGEGDGLITDRPSLGLMAVSADCPLVLAADRQGRAVGIAHASWRGTVRRIAAILVAELAGRFGVRPSDVVACVGPSAGPERYEVGEDVLQAALEGLGPGARRFFPRRQGRMCFDLWAANRDQLIGAGVPADGVRLAGVCTITRNDLFPSYRAEGSAAGRFAAVIARQ